MATVLRSFAPFTCRRILPDTRRVCARELREEDRSWCAGCCEAEARAWDAFMFAPVDAYARHIAPAVEAARLERIWP